MTRRAILLAGLSVILLAAQVTLTRVFSVVFWYHFGFLILSTALLGFGLAGLVLRGLRRRLESWDPDRALVRAVAASGVLLVLGLLVVTHVRFNPREIEQGSEIVKLVVSVLVLTPAFVVLGATVLFMLQRWSRDVGRLYAANLLGSGAGCLVAIGVLNAFGGLTGFVLLAALLPLLAAWYGLKAHRRDALVAAVAGAALLATLPFGEALFPLGTIEGKQYTCKDEDSIVFSDWTAISKLDICEDDRLHDLRGGLWGISALEAPELPDRLAAVIDRWAYTTIIEHSDDPGYYDFYDSMPLYLAYEWVERPRVLVIGSGGGMDMRAALRNGAREIHAVEINPALFRAMRDDLSELSGDLYRNPTVVAHLGEGRSYVESSDTRFDVIQLSGVDTLSATNAGAFALSESFLYTKEAMASYLDKLAEGGVLTLTRWFLPDEDGRPRNSLRLFALAVETLADRGIADPGLHIVFIRSGMFTVILVKPERLTLAEIETVNTIVDDKGFSCLYCPGRGPFDAPYHELLYAGDRDAWIADYPYNVSPPTDDSPFYFETRRVGDVLRLSSEHRHTGVDGLTILGALFLETLVVSAVLLLLSYLIQGRARRPWGWVYFLAIGLGFMLIEVTLSQRLVLFLGHPIYALSIVLFTILVFSGAGAMLSDALGRWLRVPMLLLAVAGMMLLWAGFGQPALRAMIGLPFGVRLLVAVLLMAPPAFLMGTAFPEAVRRLNAAGETELGVYWAWNGVGSVLASVLAVMIAMAAGFVWVMIAAAGCYLIAALVLPTLGARPA